ncbi:hypothetical protein Taro_010724 [Colocasia esculenta]|uniref:Uncharacterized protein n=1 Tax=Colocasia esculenta TaxID=4460 RepID=A0A843U8I4_COLES|nr:hypothetical protein [Colocasia esculenta]
MRFTTCWGHVEEFLAAGELWNDHKKVIFFPCSSATTCATHSLGINQRSKSRMGMHSSDERFKYESIYN